MPSADRPKELDVMMDVMMGVFVLLCVGLLSVLWLLRQRLFLVWRRAQSAGASCSSHDAPASSSSHDAPGSSASHSSGSHNGADSDQVSASPSSTGGLEEASQNVSSRWVYVSYCNVLV